MTRTLFKTIVHDNPHGTIFPNFDRLNIIDKDSTHPDLYYDPKVISYTLLGLSKCLHEAETKLQTQDLIKREVV